MKSPHLRQRFLAIFVAAVTASSPGCFGPNKLGTSLYKWNMGISSDKWPKEIVFAGLYLTGVYPICSFVDLFILNSIEFWSKDQPSTGTASANASERKTIVDGAHRIELERQRVADAWRVHVRVFEGDRLIDDSIPSSSTRTTARASGWTHPAGRRHSTARGPTDPWFSAALRGTWNASTLQARSRRSCAELESRGAGGPARAGGGPRRSR